MAFSAIHGKVGDINIECRVMRREYRIRLGPIVSIRMRYLRMEGRRARTYPLVRKKHAQLDGFRNSFCLYRQVQTHPSNAFAISRSAGRRLASSPCGKACRSIT